MTNRAHVQSLNDVIDSQANRIAELEKARDEWAEDAISWQERAEKAEAELARQIDKRTDEFRRAEKAERHAQLIAEAAAKVEAELAAARGERMAVDFEAAGKAAVEFLNENPNLLREVGELLDGEQPKSDVCSSCRGRGVTVYNDCADECFTCGGTGKKETK